jgi:hypothetical protein
MGWSHNTGQAGGRSAGLVVWSSSGKLSSGGSNLFLFERIILALDNCLHWKGGSSSPLS